MRYFNGGLLKTIHNVCARNIGPFIAYALVFAVPPAIASDEQVFQQAKDYTVKVRTQVAMPFLGDKKGTRIGAGFIVDANRGWVMTNAHVTSRSPSQVSIKFQGGNYLPATKLYVDPDLDLAVLALSKNKRPASLKSASLDCNGTPAVGHPVGAFGHPWELSFTGTRGIISGITSKYSGMLEMLQTDAPINPGNSGGPLISLKSGKVLGINTATRRSSQNTNFAVPMRHACRVLDLLRAGKDPSPPNLSLSFLKDIDETNRLTIARVYDDNGFSELREGDVIESIDGNDEPLENRGQLLHLLRGRMENVTFQVRRGDRQMAVRGSFHPEKSIKELTGVFVSGLLFGPTPWRDLSQLVEGKLELMVHHVERGSAGDAQRIEKMDLLYSVDGKAVGNVASLLKYLEMAHAKKKPVIFKFIRIGDMDDNIFAYIERPLAVQQPKLITWE